jgi:hypothetical protein
LAFVFDLDEPVDWILRLVKIGAEGEALDDMEINRTNDLGDIGWSAWVCRPLRVATR